MNIQRTRTPPRSLAVALAAAGWLALSSQGMAQQRPLTGRMMGWGAGAAPSAAAAAPPPAAVPAASLPPHEVGVVPGAADADAAFRATQVGDTTRYLLQRQADDGRRGTRLPMLGSEASTGYDRYMKSFSHPIPEFYESSVGRGGNNGR